MNHTWTPETEAMYTLQVWPDPPNNEEATHWGQIFEHIWKEWEAQVVNIREAEEADKGDDGEVNKDDSKQTKLKPKQSRVGLISSKRIKHPDGNLNEYFGLSQSQNSQETGNVTPVENPKKSEEANLMVPVAEG